MHVTLEVISGPEAGRRIWLHSGQVLAVGRSEDADAAFTSDSQMSGRHFSLACGAAACRLQDLGSTNGTFVNGSRVTEIELRDADEVLAGQIRFRIRLEGAAPAQPAPTPSVAAQPAKEAISPNDSEAPPPLLALLNETPFPAATMFWSTPEGEARLTVLVKATFAMVSDGIAPVAKKQVPILRADQHEGDDPLAPVRLESDMAPFKPRADVVLVGKAYAPYGRPVTELDVRLRVGALEKKVRVFGDRTWLFPSALLLVPKISSPEPFVTMELGYDRAFGGIDTIAALYCRENLLGKGFIGVKTEKAIHQKPLPNLEDPNNLINSWKSHPKPVGFGFYGRGWMPRLAYAGTFDEKYRKERSPAPPLDSSPAFFNAAHPDLQYDGYLQGGEPIELEHFLPERAMRFELPRYQPAITVRRQGSGPKGGELVYGSLDTLVLLPDEKLCYVVFRGVFPLPSLDDIDVAAITVTA